MPRSWLCECRDLRLLRAAFVGSAVFAAYLAPAGADEIDRYLRQQRNVYQVPAIVVGIIRSGKVIDSRALGSANVELNVPASAQQVYEIGSISKQFTAYAILILYEEGRVDLTAPIGRYLPELPAPWAAPTLHELMSHISGLPDFEDAFGYGVYRETPSDEEFLKRLLTLPIESEPGKKWKYSNTNYWLLAHVVERLSGVTYAQFMQERVFGPLGMKSTRAALPSQILMGRAAGYRLVDGELQNREAIQPNTGRGLGDIATTVQDMARWEQEQRAPHLVKSETSRLARRPVTLSDGSTTKYGYGWFADDTFPIPALSHNGQTAGFVAEYLRVPDRDLAIVVFANRYGAPGMATRIARLADPALRGPELKPAANADAHQTERIREFASTAAQAQSGWREDWFTAEFWADIKPYLADVEAAYHKRGPLQSVTPVGPYGVQAREKPKYRVAFKNVTRLMTFEFDDHGKIKDISSEDQ